MLKFNPSKYRGILISAALFLLLDASVLLLNFYISYEIADDAVGVNLAGRQRMLSQRMAKALFVLDANRNDPITFQSAYDELMLSKGLFDETLIAFTQGGSVRGANQEHVRLDKVSTPKGIEALQNSIALWTPYKDAIEHIITDNQIHQSTLTDAVSQAKLYNLELLKQMNNLTISLEQLATSKAIRLRTIQTVGISLAIINFLFILLHFIRQLRTSDNVLEQARQETSEILETVNEGLFLINNRLIIGDQHSAKLTDILGQTNLSGQSFQELLENIVTAKDAETARHFIELLFDPKIKEKLIGDLNPLLSVEVNIAKSSGGFHTKHLSFKFARAYQASNISHVLVTVLDISEQIKLEKALAESQKHNETQIELLTSLLHTHPSLLKEFIANSYNCYSRINNILRLPAKTASAIREKALSIFREVHNFKGEAASLNLEYFENAAHQIEDTLTHLRHKPDLNGNDYLALTVQLESLIGYTQQIEQLAEKLAQFSNTITQAKNKSASTKSIADARDTASWGNLNEYVQTLAMRNGKQVRFVASGLQDIPLDENRQQRLKEICIQLLRNAVVHGIETPADREQSEKPREGRIDLRLAKVSEHEMELTIMDDGQGLDYAAIREKAIASGRWPINDIESWDNKRLLSLIFNEGFSTSKTISTDAGRGVGLDAVMNHILSQRGKMSVSSRRGHHCRFVITLPLNNAQETIAA